MRAVILLAALLLCACEEVTGPGEIELVSLIGPNDTVPGAASMEVGAVRLRAPRFYARWYGEVEECFGLRGDYGRLRWYAYTLPWAGGPRRFSDRSLRDVYVGQQWGSEQGRVVLASTHLGSRRTIKHESGHHILALHGLSKASLAHDTTYFNVRCQTL